MEIIQPYLDEFYTLMDRGGPVMWVIFVTAWLALIMLSERTLRIRSWLRHAKRDQIRFGKSTNYHPTQPKRLRGSPIAVLLKQINWNEIKDKLDLSKQLSIHLAELMPKLEGTLPTIAIIGTLLPMLGLLGTVTGMIQVFEVIALHGTGNPQEMAHGISQALLTTASGLIIAIPIIFYHHLLVRRLRLLLAITEQSMLVIYNRNLSINRTKPQNNFDQITNLEETIHV